LIFHRLRPFLFALAAAGVSFVGVAPPASVAAASGSPPACTYQDVPAKNAAYKDWNMTMLDTIYMVPKSYVPPDLVPTAKAGLKGGVVRSFVITDLKAMANAARMADAGLRVISAYRSWSTQQFLYKREVANWGPKVGPQRVARPGHSEHQLGVAIDFGSANTNKLSWQYSDWAKTAAGAWMEHNAWKFGFILSYPKDKSPSVTCYIYEPWHYRYVGRDLAAKVHASGLTLREYLWKHYAS
jgi:D-alanyl-D-alanine carboxypeptidase